MCNYRRGRILGLGFWVEGLGTKVNGVESQLQGKDKALPNGNNRELFGRGLSVVIQIICKCKNGSVNIAGAPAFTARAETQPVKCQSRDRPQNRDEQESPP